TYGIVQPGQTIDAGVPIVRVHNFTEAGLDLSAPLRVDPAVEARYSRSRPHPGDVLISLVGSIGLVAVAPPGISGWNLARAVGLLPFHDRDDARWVAYALRSPDAQSFIHRHANTTVQATFNLKDLARLPVPYPPQRRRQQVLAVLGALDDKIELNRRMNETLEAMAQAIFRDWFVDFGPVRRKMAGATDPVAVMGGLGAIGNRAAELAALFPNALVHDRPAGWRIGTLGELAKVAGDGADPSCVAAETPYIGLEHMPRRSLALNEWDCASKVSSQKRRFRQGQILFGKLRPYFHKVGIAPVDGLCSTDIVVLDSQKPRDRELVTACVSSDEFVAFTDRSSTGTKMPRTSWALMRSFELPIPGKEVGEAFSNIVQPMHAKIVATVAENRTLAETRDYLLPRLMSGEVRVGEAEREATSALAGAG
ncbi:MAG: restriction endonuclease subunit S, partial [Caulobacteraceae bacterium]